MGLPKWHSGKESTCQCRRYKRCEFDPQVRKVSWSRIWQPAPVFLPGKFLGQRSLVDYSPCDHRFGHDWSHTHWQFCLKRILSLAATWVALADLDRSHSSNTSFTDEILGAGKPVSTQVMFWRIQLHWELAR